MAESLPLTSRFTLSNEAQRNSNNRGTVGGKVKRDHHGEVTLPSLLVSIVRVQDTIVSTALHKRYCKTFRSVWLNIFSDISLLLLHFIPPFISFVGHMLQLLACNVVATRSY